MTQTDARPRIGDAEKYFAPQQSKSWAVLEWQYGRLLDFAGISPATHPRVLDAGCGAGPALRLLDKRGYTVTGADNLLYPLQLAKEAVPRADLVVADLADGLPFADGAFDAMLLSEVIEHIPPAATDGFLRECRRVLRAGGALLITTPNLWDVRRLYAHLRHTVWSGYQDSTHINLYDPTRLSRELKAAGFGQVRWRTGLKPLYRRRSKKLRTALEIHYPPAIGNGLVAIAYNQGDDTISRGRACPLPFGATDGQPTRVAPTPRSRIMSDPRISEGRRHN